MTPDRRITEGCPEPLGLTLDATGANIAVFSRHATTIALCLFDEYGNETQRLALPGRTGQVHHGHVAGIQAGQHYGLRAEGPFSPTEGHRFNPQKLLLDPYATQLSGPVTWDSILVGHDPADPALQDPRNSAGALPKCIATEPLPRINDTERPRVPWDQTVVYEAHVKGFTRLWPEMPPDLAGTVEGLGRPEVLSYLNDLGITTLELMPIHAFTSERRLVEQGLSNHWGYNSVSFFAPEPRYLGPRGLRGLRDKVRRLHEAGIEVVLDVVYNHTGESDAGGPTLCFRGLDNLAYYARDPSAPGGYANETGCGNRLNLADPFVLRLVMDSLRWWADRIGVDGFRFDLAPSLERGEGGTAFLQALLQDPVLRERKLIFEPWDIGEDGYRLGRYKAPIAEWNDRFRDAARAFWLGRPGAPGELADGLLGSARVFDRDNRRAWSSVNFVACHDGFTTRDLTMFAQKHNEANGEGNRDGHGHNLSDNLGIEGASVDPRVEAERSRRQRNLLATALLAQGTPMLLAGDEIGHSQKGNNNAYCQDNETTWINWALADGGLRDWARRLIALRREHPVLRQCHFLHGEPIGPNRTPNVAWHALDGTPVSWEHAHEAGLALLLRGDEEASSVLIAMNPGVAPRPLVLPGLQHETWQQALDSAAPNRLDTAPSAAVAPGSLVVLVSSAGEGTRVSQARSRLARKVGLLPEYHRLDGSLQKCAPETEADLLRAMGLDASDDAAAEQELQALDEAEASGDLPDTLVVAVGRETKHQVTAWEMTLEDGSKLRSDPNDPTRLPALPDGVHLLDHGAGRTLVVAAPPRAPVTSDKLNTGRAWGVMAALYGLRSDRNLGLGDYADLAVAAEALARHGAKFLGINPVHARGISESGISPYSPSSRSSFATDHIAVDVIPEFQQSSKAQRIVADAEDRIAASRTHALVVYPAARDVQRRALRAVFDTFMDAPSARLVTFGTWLAGRSEPERLQSVFEAISEVHGPDWRTWPATLKHPENAEVADFRKAHATRIAFHDWCQWIAGQQLANANARAKAAGITLGLYLDIAVGVRPGGAETWADREAFATGASLGAPPDLLNSEGQNWDLAPFSPLGLRKKHYEPFRRMLRTTMAHAGIVRVDHVIGFMRSFWVPGSGAPGGYVAFPLDVLLALTRLEAARAGCLVVGEDLGTVPDGLREAMDNSGLYGCAILPFERDWDRVLHPGEYRQATMASFGTHDLPPMAGWWQGNDISTRERLGHPVGPNEHDQRLNDRASLLRMLAEDGSDLSSSAPQDVPDTPDDSIRDGVHRLLGHGASDLVAISLDDAFGVADQQNVPGTVTEEPNWRRKAPIAVGDITESPELERTAEVLRTAMSPKNGADTRGSPE